MKRNNRELSGAEHGLSVLAFIVGALLIAACCSGCESESSHAIEEGAFLIDPNLQARAQAREAVLNHGDYNLAITPDPNVYGVNGSWVKTDREPSLSEAWRFYSDRMQGYVQAYTDGASIYLALNNEGNYIPSLAVHEYEHAWLKCNGYPIVNEWLK